MLLFPAVVHAHHVEKTDVSLKFMADGAYEIVLEYDVNPFIVGVSRSILTDEEHAWLEALPADDLANSLDEIRAMLQRRITLRFDGVVVSPQIDFIEHSTLGRIIRLNGSPPEGAESLVFWASRAFGNIILTISRPDTAAERQLLGRADRSEPIGIAAASPPPAGHRVFTRYGVLGFEHILPKGLDHILFVLCLFLLSTRLKPLLWQVTAFTVAHTLTLALSMYGVVSLPATIVEPLIAASIAYVAVENLFTSRLQPWRPAVVFLFGLLHGLGFAGVLQELGLPRDQFVVALVGFNVGVELGQLAVIGLAFLAVGWFRSMPAYRVRVVIPASLLIAVVALYWTAERVMAG